MGNQGVTDQLDPRAKKDVTETPDHKERRGPKEKLDPRVKKDAMVVMEKRGTLDLKEKLDQRVVMEKKEIPGQLDPRVIWDRPAKKVPVVTRGPKEKLVQRVTQVPPDPRVYQG